MVGGIFRKRGNINMLKDKTLLILSHTYNSFIKDPVEILSKHFKKVYVLVRYQPIAELGNIIPLKMFSSRKKYSKRYSIDLTNKPENVEVILVPLWYLPFNFMYRLVGKMHANKVLQIIKRKNLKFDLIHAHFAWSAGYAGMKVKEKYNKPLVITGHGQDIYDMPFRSSKWRNRVKQVLNSADTLLTVSNFSKSFYPKIEVKKEPKVFLNGFNPELFESISKNKARAKLKLPMDKKIILTVGNLEKVKGYELLIEALDKVNKKNSDFVCIHIGEGTTESRVRDLIKKYKMEDKILLLGRKPHNELKYWYSASDFFVSSSLFETGPVVMFESLACGRSFIGTRVGATPDVIISEKYGKLSTPGNISELAGNILWAMNHKWDIDEITKYSMKFSWINTTDKILEEYKKLI